MERENDVQLIRRTLLGEDAAFGILVQRYQKNVQTLVWRKVGNFQDAEEITQDTFLQAYEKLSTLKNPNQFAGWLYVIANRRCIDWSRKRKLTMQSLEDTSVAEIEKSSYTHHTLETREAAAAAHRQEVVKKLLATLPESERTVVTLYYLAEMTTKEISRFMGVSVNTIKSRLRRGREHLQEQDAESLVRETLGSFQLPADFTERIMERVADIDPTPQPVKPWLPWTSFGMATTLWVLLMLGIGDQYLSRFQKPYNLDASSEPTVEIIDAVYVLDSPAKPAVRYQPGSSAIPGRSPGAGQNPDTPLFNPVPIDRIEVSHPRPQWTQTEGPEGGSVKKLFRAANGDLYADVDTDLYRLADDGTAWSRVNTHTSIKESWHMTEQNGTLYVVSDTEVLASADRGETWDSRGARPAGEVIGITTTPEAIYLGLAEGVFRSADMGNSWMSLNAGLADREVRGIAAVGDTVFVGTDLGLYRRDSEGWTQLPIDGSENIRALTTAEDRLYVAVGGKMKDQTLSSSISMRITIEDAPFSLYRSMDLGDTWRSLDFTVETDPSDGFGIEIGTPAKDAETKPAPDTKMVASGENLWLLYSGNSYYSNDAGETWATLDTKDSNSGNIASLVFSDADTFYRSGQFGIYRTTDAGETWHPFNAGLVKTEVMSLAAMPNGLYASMGHALVASSDGGKSWVDVPGDSTAVMSLVRFNGMLYAKGLKDLSPQIFQLSPEDNRFVPVPGMPTLEVPDYSMLMSGEINKALSETVQDASQKASEDGKKQGAGNTNLNIFTEDHSEIIEGSMMEFLRVLFGSFAVSDRIYYVEHGRKLLRWKLGTTQWSDTGFVDESELLYSIENFKDPSTLHFNKLAVLGKAVYVGRLDGHLFRSFDEGETWRDITTDLPYPVTAFNAITVASSTVYLATDKGVVYSKDGTTWRGTTAVEGTPLVIERFAVDGSAVYGISNQQVFRLQVESDTWQPMTPEIPASVTSLAVDRDVLYVGTIGSGVLRFTLDETP